MALFLEPSALRQIFVPIARTTMNARNIDEKHIWPSSSANFRSAARYFALLALLAIGACSGSKGMYKKGEKLREAGSHAEASEYYFKALMRKSDNVDAQIALKKTGGRVLEDKLALFYQAHAVEDHTRAVQAYSEAVLYAERAKAVGVILEIPTQYEAMYRESRDAVSARLYDQAREHLRNEEFAKAEEAFAQVNKLNPDFKDAGALKTLSRNEPLYREGLELYDAGRYREAYFKFDAIEQQSGYKDSRNLRQICLENGRYPIAMIPFDNKSGYPGVETAVASSIASAILKSNDPFVQLVDRAQHNQIMEEQIRQMRGEVSSPNAIKIGELTGAKALLSGSVHSAVRFDSGLKSTSQTGFSARPVKRKDPKTGEMKTFYEYDLVTYRIYSREVRFSIGYSYQLSSTETGRILAADQLSAEDSDRIEYTDYSGNPSRFYPGKRAPGGKWEVDFNASSRSSLSQLVGARQSVRSPESMSEAALAKLASKVSAEVVRQSRIE